MPINRITGPNSTPTVVGDYQAQNNQIGGLILREDVIPWTGTTMTEGLILQVGGTLYKVEGTVTITGTESDYVRIVPAGATATAEFVSSLSGVSWDVAGNGMYDGSGRRYIVQPWTWTGGIDKSGRDNNAMSRSHKLGIDFIRVDRGNFTASTSISYGKNIAIVTRTNSILSSTNLYDWTSTSLSGVWRSSAYGNGVFVICGAPGTSQTIARSTDGITFTKVGPSTSTDFFSCKFLNGNFIVTSGTSGQYSNDLGLTWSSFSLPFAGDIAFGNGRYVLVGSSAISYSSDLLSWTSGTISAKTWVGIDYGNGLFVAISSSSGVSVATSSDGITFSDITQSTDSLRVVKYYNGFFYAHKVSTNELCKSKSGSHWTFYSSPVTLENGDSSAYSNGIKLMASSTGNAANAYLLVSA